MKYIAVKGAGSPKCAFYLTKIRRDQSFDEVYSAIEILEDQASHISPLMFISLFGECPGSSLSSKQKSEMFLTQ